MSEIQPHTTGLTSQYIAQVTSDLERNVKEQERISAEIEVLQEQLRALKHDRTVLVSIQEALGGASAVGEAGTTAAPTVPHQVSAELQQSKPKKAVATSAKATASNKSAVDALSATAPKTATRPTLVNLIRSHLEQQGEPRSAAEISAALTQAYPDRRIKTTVVRTTLEGLVAKSQAQRSRQGSSVFYITAAASEPAVAEAQQEAVAD
ncbi:hypothetical protein [Streptomyces sp. NPDC002403]